MTTNDLLSGNNDNVLQLLGLKNGIDDSFVNDAVITAELKDSTGNAVPGMDWPATMSYVADSKGGYRLLLDSALNLTDGHYYTLTVNVEAGGLNASWRKYLKATSRA